MNKYTLPHNTIYFPRGWAELVYGMHIGNTIQLWNTIIFPTPSGHNTHRGIKRNNVQLTDGNITEMSSI